MILFLTERIEENIAYLIEDEHRHCAKVLRKRVGEEITMTDGSGNKYIGAITEIGRSETKVIISSTEIIEAPSHSLHIAISPTKNNARFEWFLEKATEIGIQRITPLLCKRTERPRIKMERLQKIMKSAATQSLKFHFPLLDELLSIGQLLDTTQMPLYIAHFDELNKNALHTIPPNQDALIIIGPEGDFTDEEVEWARAKNAISVNLSPYRLRTETAGLAACQIYHSVNVNT